MTVTDMIKGRIILKSIYIYCKFELGFNYMLVREKVLETKINEIYLNNINILSLLTTFRSRALTLCSLCALCTEHFRINS